ncbi:MAG: PP0621 family protein [Pseudomonadota bacterium]
MKYVLVLVVVVVVIYWWRGMRDASLRANAQARSKKERPATLGPTEIVACRVCDVHLPRQEALPGGDGYYCSEAHRKQDEQVHH